LKQVYIGDERAFVWPSWCGPSPPDPPWLASLGPSYGKAFFLVSHLSCFDLKVNLLATAGHKLVKSSYFLGDPPPDPRFLASLGALSLVDLDHCSVVDLLTGRTGPKDLLIIKSSYFLGDPPPDPRFLASLGALSLVDLDHCSVVDLLTGRTGPSDPLVSHRISWGILPRPPVSRFARGAVTGRPRSRLRS
jgi:hypothetical protein